jgi:lysophosphatidic acid acyltransferase / lysophosphatidylinositol acyltransferase
MPSLKHHLIPRTKGFTASLPVLKKKCDVIMDVQLAFHENDEHKPTIINLLRGKSITGHIYLRRVPMSDVPEDEKEAAQWLQDLYVRKDKLQASFHETGDFFKTSGITRIEPINFKPRLYTLLNWIAWMVIAMLPILYYLISMIMSGQIFYVLIGIAIFFSCKDYFAIKRKCINFIFSQFMFYSIMLWVAPRSAKDQVMVKPLPS